MTHLQIHACTDTIKDDYGPPTGGPEGKWHWSPAGVAGSSDRRRKAAGPLLRPSSASPRMNGRQQRDAKPLSRGAPPVGGDFEKGLIENNEILTQQLQETEEELETLREEKEAVDQSLRAAEKREFKIKADVRRKLNEARDENEMLVAKLVSQETLSESVIHKLRQKGAGNQRCPVCNRSTARTAESIVHQHARKPSSGRRPRSASAAASGRRTGPQVRIRKGDSVSSALQDSVTRHESSTEEESKATIYALCKVMKEAPDSRDVQHFGCCAITRIAPAKDTSAIMLGSAGACKTVVDAIHRFPLDVSLNQEGCRAILALAKDCIENISILRSIEAHLTLREIMGLFPEETSLLEDAEAALSEVYSTGEM